ncbi:MAG: outer membrane protein, partial [Myxococcales bacterium]|nr:outer membrane protein [Myxococcales bacterium]
MRTALFTVFIALVPRVSSAEPKLNLAQVIEKAVAGPRVQMAEDDRDAASARVDEADAARYPRIKATAFATISPEIRCVDTPRLCLETQPKNFAFKFSGLYGSAQLDLTQPLYTFGKISHARSAARAGVSAQEALADEAAGDVAADAARAYWGLKLARELGGMLDDGIEEIEKAKVQFDEKPDTTIQDRQRVAVLLAEAKAQRAEATQGEAQALAGLRAVTSTPDADIDDAPLAAVDQPVPDARFVAAGAQWRPQAIAAKSGAAAGDELA